MTKEKIKDEILDQIENPEHPPKFYRISQTQMSIARHYGGIVFNGKQYIYNPIDDTLTREDVWKKENMKKKKSKKKKLSKKFILIKGEVMNTSQTYLQRLDND